MACKGGWRGNGESDAVNCRRKERYDPWGAVRDSRFRRPRRCRKGLDYAHISVYTLCVKRIELERRLSELGWYFLRHGGNHDVWTDGDREETIPRHNEINENLARRILRRAGGTT